MIAHLALIAVLVQPIGATRPDQVPARPPVQPAPAAPPTTPSPVPPTTIQFPMKCLPRAELVESIKKNADAVPLFLGTAGFGADGQPTVVLEFWRDPVSGTDRWMSFFTRPNGIACIVAQGKGIGYADPNIVAPSLSDDQSH